MDVFEAVADPVRRDLLRRLARGPSRVTDLAGEHEISRPAISRHLRVLREAGLVEAEATGRERPHRLVRDALAPLQQLVGALLAEPVDARPPVDGTRLDALALEIRRTSRDASSPVPTEVEDSA